jgi:hypothetical protein
MDETRRDGIKFCAVVDQPSLVFGDHAEAAHQIGRAIGADGCVDIEAADLDFDTVTLTLRVRCPVVADPDEAVTS